MVNEPSVFEPSRFDCIMNFVAVSSVGIKRVDCTLYYFLVGHAFHLALFFIFFLFLFYRSHEETLCTMILLLILETFLI